MLQFKHIKSFLIIICLAMELETVDGEGCSGEGSRISGGSQDTKHPPCKKPKLKPACIIHSTDEDPEKGLIQPKDFASWQSLLKAAQIRQHRPILDIALCTPDGDVPSIFYHRTCRCKFTLKRDLEDLQSKSATVETASQVNRRTPRQPSTVSRVYEKSCIFCQREKYRKGSKTRETLVQCVDLRADSCVRETAVAKQDERILGLVLRDIVAAEAHYHRSCYRNYTRKAEPENADSRKSENQDDLQYQEAEKSAYEDLFDYIRNSLFADPRVMKMVDLKTLLVDSMARMGIAEVQDSTRKHIRRKLEVEFKDTLHIFPDRSGKLLVIPDNLTVYELAWKNQILTEEIQSLQVKVTSNEKMLDSAACIIRKDIKNPKIEEEWPYLPDSVDKNTMKLPESLKRFLIYLLTGEASPQRPAERVLRLVDSFAQDIIYSVTGGKQKTPKHILLPAAVKALTGSTQLIQALNRLGHGISYSQLEENETAICLQKLASATEGSVTLPKNIRPCVFTTLAWDNIDFLEETLTGGGTSHRVNGIVVQPVVHGPDPATVKPPSVLKQKQRSITPEEFAVPVYNAGQRRGPGVLKFNHQEEAQEDMMKEAFRKDLLWVLARQINVEEQTICSWTGFNIATRKGTQIIQDNVGYLPTINAPATDMATAAEILTQASKIMEQLNLSHVVVVFDQALYAKVAEVLWKHKEEHPGIILRLGTFHTICNFISILGKRFQDAGLRDLCIESGIVAEGSVAAVIEGRHYNRAVRVHKYVFEALMRLAWRGFSIWIDEHQPDERVHLDKVIDLVSELQDDTSKSKVDELLGHAFFVSIVDQFQDYLEFLRNRNGPLSSMWMSYIDMVERVLLGLIRASREGNWDLHMAAIQEMIPWCFAYDKTNYARYLPVYFAEMSQLPMYHPEVHKSFQEGRFSVQLGSENPFGKIPVDQTTEETVNKDTKTAGGVRKYSLKPGAVTRFYLTAEHRSGFVRKFREMVGLGNSDIQHAELQSPRIRKDEAAVSSVLETLENWVNPFQGSPEMVSLSTAAAVPEDIVTDLLRARDAGVNAYKQFREERLEADLPKFKFHDKLTKLKLKTFTDMTKKKVKIKGKDKDFILKADRKLFGQMILIAQTRKELNMKNVLSHPLGPLPWALATPDGQPRKTNKAALAREMQKEVSVAEIICQPSATIIDGMALVQKAKVEQKSFGQVADSILSAAFREGAQSSRVDIVFDVYREQSIKSAERLNRCHDFGVQYRNIVPGQMVRQWRKFLQSTDNKTALIQFLVQQWKEPTSKELIPDGKELFVTLDELCYKITQEAVTEVQELEAHHEEADTRLLLHAKHAAECGSSSVIITTEDTDVFLLCLAFSDSIGVPLYQKSRSRTQTRFVDISKVASAFGAEVCKGLLGLHAFTGCDSVSAFAGRGKVNALKMMKKDKNIQDVMGQVGSDWTISDELFTGLKKFTCQLYGSKTDDTQINEYRYQLFCSRKGEIESHQLPPCEDCLFKHAQRANYQAGIWKRSLEKCPSIPSPIGSGWKLESVDGQDELLVDWMEGAPAPDSVLELLACKCTRSCQPQSCPCISNGMKCSDMCKLKSCENQDNCESDSDLDPVSDDDFDDVEVH